MKRVPLLLCFMSMAFISACGGGSSSSSDNGSPGGNVVASGVVYPVVTGLTYQTDSGSGVVGSDGSYNFKTNENVTFSAGGIELATVPAAPKVTPVPLDDEAASTNMLRLFKALDTDANLANGISLPQLPTSEVTTVDLSSETSVATALNALAPTATLPPASDAQVATTLAETKATALQNLGNYGSTYRAITVWTRGSALSGLPRDAVVTLTSQPNWTTGTVTGSIVFTFNDNSTTTVPVNSDRGSYTVSGNTFDYILSTTYSARSRILLLTVRQVQQSTGILRFTMRDNAQPNRAPVPGIGLITFTVPTLNNTGRTYTFSSIPTGPGEVWQGSKDFDGIIVSQSWVSSKGKTGTGNVFSEEFFPSESGTVTLTVTDDEGATASKTFEITGSAPATAFTAEMLGGKTVQTTIDGESAGSFLLNADGTWIENSTAPDRESGTWRIDDAGRFVALNISAGVTLDTLTVTIISGSLPTFEVNFSDVLPDGTVESGVGTITIN